MTNRTRYTHNKCKCKCKWRLYGLRQGNESKQLAQGCYTAMSGMAAREGNWTRHVTFMPCFFGKRVNHYTTAPIRGRRKGKENSKPIYSSVWSTQIINRPNTRNVYSQQSAVCLCGENYWFTVLPFHRSFFN